ncbi:MAG: 3'(2'),5'-bisphosphate nucleotidase CysQ [Actinomycetota bacterium]
MAAHLAAESGWRLLEVRERLHGQPEREIGDEGDRVSQAFLATALAEARPADAVLSEEAADNGARLACDRVWVIDPLDGTREYGEGRTDWAVHVALWSGGRLAAGAVALPGAGQVFSTARPLYPAAAGGGGRLRLVVSRSRPPELVVRLAPVVGADLVPLGSAGAKAMAVVTGDADAYVHGGGMWEWDSAAPVAVALAAGLHASRLDGSPLVYNQPSPWLPDLVICRPELAPALLGAIAALPAGNLAPPPP